MNINLDSFNTAVLIDKIVKMHEQDLKEYKNLLTKYDNQKHNLNWQIEATKLATRLDLLEDILPELREEEF
jgi:hypothetical protein